MNNRQTIDFTHQTQKELPLTVRCDLSSDILYAFREPSGFT